MKKVAFIGFGAMAQALYDGMRKQGVLDPKDVLIVEMEPKKAQSACNEGASLVSLAELNCAHMIWCCVKPQHVEALMQDLSLNKSSVLISIVAGAALSRFEQYEKQALVRVMPNTPAQLGKGASGVFFNDVVSLEDKEAILKALNSVGLAIQVNEESHIDMVTALSGSGPAFFYQMVVDMMSFSKQNGFDEAQAQTLLAQTLIGAGEMLIKTGKKPDELIAQVKSKGGTTEAGLNCYDEQKIGDSLKELLDATLARAKALK